MWQTDGAAHKLKLRSFHKSTHLQVYSVDFHPGVNCAWHPNTFHMNHKLFELLIIFFNMINSLATFQTMMNNIFQDLIVEKIMIVYLVNIF